MTSPTIDPSPPLPHGEKHDAGKPPLSLIDRRALEQIAHVLDFGARKYAPHNWRQGLAWSRLIDAALRHLYAFADGEDLDPESGLPHLAHAGCCIVFLLGLADRTEFDDRHTAMEHDAGAAALHAAAAAMHHEAECLRESYMIGEREWVESGLIGPQDIAAAKREYAGLIAHAETVERACALLTNMREAWAYFSEYDVPIGMRERIVELVGDNVEVRGER